MRGDILDDFQKLLDGGATKVDTGGREKNARALLTCYLTPDHSHRRGGDGSSPLVTLVRHCKTRGRAVPAPSL